MYLEGAVEVWQLDAEIYKCSKFQKLRKTVDGVEQLHYLLKIEVGEQDDTWVAAGMLASPITITTAHPTCR